LVEGDIRDRALLQEVLQQGIEGVMHFAAFIEAGESMQDPIKYFENNVVGSEILFSEVLHAGVQRVIFSSTAAVYASSDEPLTEDHALKPANVYGQTKRMMEEMLHWLHETKGIKVGILRYFNAAGASLLDSPPKRGEAHVPETHLIPNILDVALGKKEQFRLYGNDYNTPDGTCVRDYIHVDDLARAHMLALQILVDGRMEFDVFNLGNGQGFSNTQVLEAAQKVTGNEIPVRVEGRREGDAARLVASSDKAKNILGWQPQHLDLETIITSAWEWCKIQNNLKNV
jgi:UDP-glucose 4-epimerase